MSASPSQSLLQQENERLWDGLEKALKSLEGNYLAPDTKSILREALNQKP